MSRPYRLLPAVLLSLSPTLAAAQVLNVAFGESLEPYVMPQQASGIEVEIIREALRAEGLGMQPVFMAQKRLPLALKNPRIDAIATIRPDSGLKAAYSDPYVYYEDVAITLRSRNLQLREVAELGKYSISAFPLATQYLGAEFARMAANNPRYGETGNQVDQNRLLYRHLIDVVVADQRIFKYMNQRVVSDFREVVQPVSYHQLFEKLPYRVAFRSAALRDRFNRGLATLNDNGLYQQILNRFQYADSVD